LQLVTDIARVEQLDAVYRPAAGGELQRIMAAVGPFTYPVSQSDDSQFHGTGEPVSPAHQMEAHMTVPIVPVVTPAEDRAAELLKAQETVVLEAKLSASALPEALQELVRQTIKPGWRVSDLDKTIENTKTAWAAQLAKTTVDGVHPVSGMTPGRDVFMQSFRASLGDPEFQNKGLRPVGLKEAYIALSVIAKDAACFMPSACS
jgi:hypothetical protein